MTYLKCPKCGLVWPVSRGDEEQYPNGTPCAKCDTPMVLMDGRAPNHSD
jgi:hypothetical protein